MKKELTTEEKWARVDEIINWINKNKTKDNSGCTDDFEEYINYNFNK